MLRPSYAIAVGATSLSSRTLGPLASVLVERAQNGGPDGALLALGRFPDVAPAQGDPVTVELGWDGSTTLVFTGEVDAVDGGIRGLEVDCVGTLARLARARGNQTFVNQTAGEIVSALASGAGVDTGTVEAGVQLPVYVCDSGRSHHAHCLRLARWCGFDLWADAGGALAFGRYARVTADHSYRFGAEVLAASVTTAAPPDGSIVVPESPASSQGDETASWLVKDPSPHAAGSGAAIVSEPALRTKDAADSAASAAVARGERAAVNGRVELAGAPAVALGDAVALAGMPDDALDRTYQVLAVRHVLDRRHGFRTRLALGGTP